MILYAIIVPQLLLLAATAEATDCTAVARCRWISEVKYELSIHTPPSTLERLCSNNVRTECTFNIACPDERIEQAAATRLVEIMTFLCSPNGTRVNNRLQTNCDSEAWQEIKDAIDTCGICHPFDCGNCRANIQYKTCTLQHGQRICGPDFATIFNLIADPVVYRCDEE